MFEQKLFVMHKRKTAIVGAMAVTIEEDLSKAHAIKKINLLLTPAG